MLDFIIIGFSTIIVTTLIVVAMNKSAVVRIIVCGALGFALILGLLFAGANALADEIRTTTIVEFDLEHGEFVLEDEDGFTWAFALEKGDYALEDEYVLVLPDDGEPWCYKAPSAPLLPIPLR